MREDILQKLSQQLLDEFKKNPEWKKRKDDELEHSHHIAKAHLMSAMDACNALDIPSTVSALMILQTALKLAWGALYSKLEDNKSVRSSLQLLIGHLMDQYERSEPELKAAIKKQRPD